MEIVEQGVELKLARVISGRYKQIRDKGSNADILRYILGVGDNSRRVAVDDS